MSGLAEVLDKKHGSGEFITNAGGNSNFVGQPPLTAEDPYPHDYRELEFVWVGEAAALHADRLKRCHRVSQAIGGAVFSNQPPQIETFQVNVSGDNQFAPPIDDIQISAN